jgi:uncharacterized coiled-coil DUF342 family protein
MVKKNLWNIIFLICFTVTGILLYQNLHKSDHRIQDALNKLDSTRYLLDSARAQIDSSKLMISSLQDHFQSYSVYLTDMSSKVNLLDAQRRKNEAEFNRKISEAKVQYEKTKNNILQYRRPSWPEIKIDTTH